MPVGHWRGWLGFLEFAEIVFKFTLFQVESIRLSNPYIHSKLLTIFGQTDCVLINLENTKLYCQSKLSNHTATANGSLCGHCTSAVSSPLIVIQTSRSLCLNPNPFLEEPNKLNLVPVRDIWKVITNYLITFAFGSKGPSHKSKYPVNYPLLIT